MATASERRKSQAALALTEFQVALERLRSFAPNERVSLDRRSRRRV
jgi:hypothetical protein